MRELLGHDATFERREVEWRDPSVEGYADFMLTSFGPLLNAQEVLGPYDVILDGTDINNVYNKTPGSAAGVLLGVEAVLEFQVLTNMFTAEYGTASGPIVNILTRSGTNDLTGTVYGYSNYGYMLLAGRPEPVAAANTMTSSVLQLPPRPTGAIVPLDQRLVSPRCSGLPRRRSTWPAGGGR